MNDREKEAGLRNQQYADNQPQADPGKAVGVFHTHRDAAPYDPLQVVRIAPTICEKLNWLLGLDFSSTGKYITGTLIQASKRK